MSQTKSRAASERRKQRIAHEAEGAVSGALAGAVIGATGGPPGVVAGAIIGSVVGAMTGNALDGDTAEQAERTEELDAQIGTSGGELGAPVLKHPPSKS